MYSDAGDEAPWRPYEKAYAENAVLMPWVPRKFYQFRWAIMNHSPFVRRFWRGQYTVGELIVTLLIIAQMLWITMHWAIDTDGFRRDIKRTGAPRRSPPCRTVPTALGQGCPLRHP